MELNKLLRADYLDILFDGRNKTYGGYELRRMYPARARRANISVLIGVALAAAIPLIASSLSANETRLMPVTTVTRLDKVILPEQPKEPPVRIVTPPPPPVETFRDPLPKINHDNEQPDPPPSADEHPKAEPGLSNNTGLSTETGIIPSGPTGTGKILVDAPEPPKEVVYKFVDQDPHFPGDLEKYLRDHLAYPESAREIGITGTVGVQFIVNEDGSISGITILKKAAPALEAEAIRVVRAMRNWMPG